MWLLTEGCISRQVWWSVSYRDVHVLNLIDVLAFGRFVAPRLNLVSAKQIDLEPGLCPVLVLTGSLNRQFTDSDVVATGESRMLREVAGLETCLWVTRPSSTQLLSPKPANPAKGGACSNTVSIDRFTLQRR